MRRLIPVVAALALIAPSCPRDFGPPDYDPDATRPFTPGANVEDLVYAAAASAKGDSDYVVAMPSGDTIARIDGPDRRGWVFASETLSYYPVMRHGPASSNTIHRIDLPTGSRARIIADDRPAVQFLYETGASFTAVALTTDKRKLLVARVLSSGPRLWVGRYEAASGALEAQRSWPIAAIAANVRLAAAGEVIVMVTSTLVDGGKVTQEMRFLDASLNEVATLVDDDLPQNERCAAGLRPVEGGLATICAGPEGRYASAIVIDRFYRVASRVPLALAARERAIAWTAQDGVIGILTDHARHVRVGADRSLTSSWLAEPDGRTTIRIAREIAPGVVIAQFNLIAEGQPVGDIAVVDVSAGRLLSRTATADTALDFVAAGDRLYVLLSRVGGLGPRLQRLDRDSLAPLGRAATLPQRDDVVVHGLIAVVPAR